MSVVKVSHRSETTRGLGNTQSQHKGDMKGKKTTNRKDVKHKNKTVHQPTNLDALQISFPKSL
jgi:hypothetical protein